ncbi:unnamed protein product [marine sediment metagenome]|uniref:Uncharacterized protein n=1 Tax=marine sediment metagenome TaxID=412755 RepID=X1CXY0_9ZZZZ
MPSNYAIDTNSDYPSFNDKEMQAVEWIITYKEDGSEIYTDNNGRLLFFEFFTKEDNIIRVFWAETEKIKDNSYLYFRTINIKGKIISIRARVRMKLENSKINKVINNMNKIYDNGGSELRLKTK